MLTDGTWIFVGVLGNAGTGIGQEMHETWRYGPSQLYGLVITPSKCGLYKRIHSSAHSGRLSGLKLDACNPRGDKYGQ
jgi:hypothetical protein